MTLYVKDEEMPKSCDVCILDFRLNKNNWFQCPVFEKCQLKPLSEAREECEIMKDGECCQCSAQIEIAEDEVGHSFTFCFDCGAKIKRSKNG